LRKRESRTAGGEVVKMMVTVVDFLECAHQLPDMPWLTTKKCCNLHGHTYKVEMDIEAEGRGGIEMEDIVVDFGRVKEVLRRFDHRYLNDEFKKVKNYESRPTTAENFATLLWQEVQEILPAGTFVVGVRVWEGFKGDQSNLVTLSY